MSRVGKIARLSLAVREQLGRRLENHEPGDELLAWLNGLQETRKMLEKLFGGAPINKQNLSEWRLGGHREWQAQQEAARLLEGMSSEAAKMQPRAGEPLTEQITPWLVARYFVNVKTKLTDGGKVDELKLLHGFCGDLVALRRGDHSSARLKLAQERLKKEDELTDEGIVDFFYNWAKNPEVSEWVRNNTLPEDEKRRRLRATFGLPQEEGVADGQ